MDLEHQLSINSLRLDKIKGKVISAGIVLEKLLMTLEDLKSISNDLKLKYINPEKGVPY